VWPPVTSCCETPVVPGTVLVLHPPPSIATTGEEKKSVLHVALGGGQVVPGCYFRGLQHFAVALFVNGKLTPRGPWTLRVLLGEDTREREEVKETVALLAALGGCEVVYSPLRQPSEFATARYLIHDAPDVERYLVLDGHYLWEQPDQFKTFDNLIKQWESSGSPFMAARYRADGRSKTGLEGRAYAGGWFGGVPGRSPLQRGDMVEELKWWFAKKGPPHQASAYGEDEEFLTYLVEQLKPITAGFIPPFTSTPYNTKRRFPSMGCEEKARAMNTLKKCLTGSHAVAGLPLNWQPANDGVRRSAKRRRKNG
jgi:hypothetical protein